ncbi:hypothetical protein BCR44DRAFT_185142 [Catenaria anguillulae PL171]|uniref:Uncharacterized protein n=1 Tax=Catenaria anguillulae PL171 TaxID=765915 RepID=A0A1Y2HVF5_9FUNG|nr:hypothetical protein BCR44DRAFT_185142 [Catenaria anguillulae PL171]
MSRRLWRVSVMSFRRPVRRGKADHMQSRSKPRQQRVVDAALSPTWLPTPESSPTLLTHSRAGRISSTLSQRPPEQPHRDLSLPKRPSTPPFFATSRSRSHLPPRLAVSPELQHMYILYIPATFPASPSIMAKSTAPFNTAVSIPSLPKRPSSPPSISATLPPHFVSPAESDSHHSEPSEPLSPPSLAPDIYPSIRPPPQVTSS